MTCQSCLLVLRFWTQASSEAQWQVPQNEMASAITDMSSIHISHLTCLSNYGSKHECFTIITSCSLQNFRPTLFIPTHISLLQVMQCFNRSKWDPHSLFHLIAIRWPSLRYNLFFTTCLSHSRSCISSRQLKSSLPKFRTTWMNTKSHTKTITCRSALVFDSCASI